MRHGASALTRSPRRAPSAFAPASKCGARKRLVSPIVSHGSDVGSATKRLCPGTGLFTTSRSTSGCSRWRSRPSLRRDHRSRVARRGSGETSDVHPAIGMAWPRHGSEGRAALRTSWVSTCGKQGGRRVFQRVERIDSGTRSARTWRCEARRHGRFRS